MHIVDRARACKLIDQVVVATTTDSGDDPLASFLDQHDVPLFRGSTEDVLARYVGAARQFGGDLIVRLTGDDPLKDPAVMTQVIQAFLDRRHELDYVSNTIKPTFPEGQDVEVVTSAALFEADRTTVSAYDREHVTPFFYNHPEHFRLLNVVHSSDLSHLRWTLDTEDDFRFFSAVFARLGMIDYGPTMAQVLELLRSEPEISEINAKVNRSARYVSH